jgi:hypothetical protein
MNTNNQKFKKIDNGGNYCHFPGVTVVANIAKNEYYSMWDDIYSELKGNNLIIKYYSLLPVDSYHMTTIGLYTRREVPENWNDFFDKNLPFFESLSVDIEDRYHFQPKISSFDTGKASSVIYVNLSLDSEQAATNFDLAKKHNLVGHLFPYHLTFGYQYKGFEDMSLQKAVQEELDRIVNNVKEKYQISKENLLTLESPHLCYFHDMTKFIQWNGTFNPFQESEETK